MTTSNFSRSPGGINLPAVTSPSPANQSSEIDIVHSDFVIILAALLCGLICVLGLITVARCAWIRRITLGNTVVPPPAPANKGLKKKVLKSLPKFSYTLEQTAKFSECAICLTGFVDGDEIRVLPLCGHGFHVGCIDTWLGSHSSCPSCRQIPVVSRCDKCGSVGGESGGSRLVPTDYHVNAFLP